MPELSCPACGTHLELGLTAVTSTGQEKVDSPAVAGMPNNNPMGTLEPVPYRFLLKGEVIKVDPQKMIEVALKEVNPASSTSGWVCTWVYDDKTAELAHPVRAVLMAYLEAEYPAVDWANLGVTTNDAVRIIGKFIGFAVSNLRAHDLSMPDFRTLYKKPEGRPVGSLTMRIEGPDAEIII